MTPELFFQVLGLVMTHAVVGAVARWALSTPVKFFQSTENHFHFKRDGDDATTPKADHP